MNYSQIVDTAKAYADRNTDVEINANIDVFVTLAEAKANRILRTRKQSTRAYLAVVEEDKAYHVLPDDYSGMRDIQINLDMAFSTTGLDAKATYVAPDLMNDLKAKKKSITQVDKYVYTVIGNQLEIYPCVPDQTSIEIVYYQKIPNLNSTDNENWVSIDHPDVYIAGIMSEIELFAKNYDVSKVWHDRMILALNDIEDSDISERWSGSQLRIRVEGAV